MAEVYFPYYSRKWKASTRVNNMNRVSIHLVDGLGPLELSSFRRDGLQDLLDERRGPVFLSRRSIISVGI